MLNYLQAELYKTIQRRIFYLLIGGLSGLCLLFHILYLSLNPSLIGAHYVSAIAQSGIQLFFLPIFLVSTVSSLTVGEENRHDTLKNAIMSGTSRLSVYAGKLLVSFLISLVGGAIILFCFIGVPLLIFGGGGGAEEMLGELAMRLLGATPVFVAQLALANLLGLVLKNNLAAIFSYFGITFLGKTIVYYIVGLVLPWVKEFTRYTPEEQIGAMMEFGYIGSSNGTIGIEHITTAAVTEAMLVGLGFTLFFLALGAILFKRQEIK